MEETTRPAGMRIVVEQLDDQGKTFRTFYRHPHNEDAVDVAIGRIERGYLMSRTRITVERPGQPDEVIGVHRR